MTRGRYLAEQTACGGIFILGAITAQVAAGYGLVREAGRIGPGFVPFTVGVGLVAVAAFIAAVNVQRNRATSGPQHPSVDQTPDMPSRPTLIRAGVILVSSAALVALIPTVGHLASFGVLAAALLFTLERSRPSVAIIYGIGLAGATWLIFVQALNIRLAP